MGQFQLPTQKLINQLEVVWRLVRSTRNRQPAIFQAIPWQISLELLKKTWNVDSNTPNGPVLILIGSRVVLEAWIGSERFFLAVEAW